MKQTNWILKVAGVSKKAYPSEGYIFTCDEAISLLSEDLDDPWQAGCDDVKEVDVIKQAINVIKKSKINGYNWICFAGDYEVLNVFGHKNKQSPPEFKYEDFDWTKTTTNINDTGWDELDCLQFDETRKRDVNIVNVNLSYDKEGKPIISQDPPISEEEFKKQIKEIPLHQRTDPLLTVKTLTPTELKVKTDKLLEEYKRATPERKKQIEIQLEQLKKKSHWILNLIRG